MLASMIVLTGLLLWVVAAMWLLARSERPLVVVGRNQWNVPLYAALVALASVALRAPPVAAASCGVACTALVVAGAGDAKTGYLFDAITLPAAILSAALAVAAGAGADAAAGVILVVGVFGFLVLASRGRLMGLGDVKAMFALGAAFGPLEFTIALFAACASGVVAAALRRSLQRGSEVRFGPHLALGGAVALLLGDPLSHLIVGT